MRKSWPFVWKPILWSIAIAVLCALVPGAAVRGLVQTVPNLAVPATALAFTLITAASRNRQ